MSRRYTLRNYLAAPGNWLSTILLLMVEHFGSRYKRTNWAAIVAILEPIGAVAVFWAVHSLISLQPTYGSSDFLFFTTGIIPFYLFFHISWTIRTWDGLRRTPRTSEFDLLLSHVLDEFFIKLFIICICCTGLWIDGVAEAVPNDPFQCLVALVILALMGTGVGLLNAVIVAFFNPWIYIYAILMRGWMAFSGVLYVVDWMPPQLRDIAVYNPLSHAITWYRAAQYPNYPTLLLDREYAVIFAGLILALGVITLNFTKPWRPLR